MNTKNISTKLKYEEYLKYDNMIAFIRHVEAENVLSDIEFIEVFKHKGLIFWFTVVINTNISIKLLFFKYKKYLLNKELYTTIKKHADFLILTNKESNLNCGLYLSEYLKYTSNEY